jgi:hypothetical protein
MKHLQPSIQSDGFCMANGFIDSSASKEKEEEI